MLFADGIFAIAFLALWLYCILDVISSEEALIRNLPKMVWLLIVIFLPEIGSIAWLIAGRPPKAGFAPGDTNYRKDSPRFGSVDTVDRPSAPDDDPKFLAQIDDHTKQLREWEEDLKRREDELKRKEEGEA